MKRFFLLSVLLFGLLPGLHAQLVRKTYSVSRHYNELQAVGAFSIVYSDRYDKLTLVVPKKLEPFVKVEIFKEKPALRIRYTKNKIELNDDPVPVLYVPVTEAIDKLTIDGCSLFQSDGPIDVSRFEIDVDGAAVVECRFDMPDGTLVVDADGTALLNLQGEVGVLKLDLDGATALHADKKRGEYTFCVRKAYCNMDGVSHAGFHCIDYLEAECGGVCILNYSGHPEVHARKSGFSVVKATGHP